MNGVQRRVGQVSAMHRAFPRLLADVDANAERQMFAPAPWQVPGPSGDWVGITRQPHHVCGPLFKPGAVFWAERCEGARSDGRAPDGTFKCRVPLPRGEAFLFPHEITVLERESVVQNWSSGLLEFEPWDIDVATFGDVMFYALSRGISRADALVMALGDHDGPIGHFRRVLS